MKRAFINVNIIDVIHKQVLNGYSIVTEDGYIKEIGKEINDLDCEVVDCKGAYLSAGLFNCHVHLSCDCTMEGALRGKRSAFELTLIAIENAKKLIEGGFTFVRDVGTHLNIAVEFANAVRKGKIMNSPDVIASANPICMTGGCCSHAFGYEADGEDQCRKATREMIKNGARWIKLMATGGVMTPGSIPGAPQLTQKEMEACVQEAHKAGIKVCVHAEGIEGTLNALRAGVDCIEHGDELNDECIELMLKNNVPLIGTVSTCDCILSNMIDKDEEIIQKSNESNLKNKASWTKAYKAGVLCGCGSDAGTAYTPFEQSYMEIVYLADNYGAGNYEALKMATINSAIICGVDDQLGTIEVGKKAHFALFKENPIEDINAISNCIMTVKNGEVLYQK